MIKKLVTAQLLAFTTKGELDCYMHACPVGEP